MKTWFKGANIVEGIRAYANDAAGTERWLERLGY